jgi:hypothetical protein
MENLLVDKNGRYYIGDLGSSRFLEGATRLSDDKNTVKSMNSELCTGKSSLAVCEGFGVGQTMYVRMTGDGQRFRWRCWKK